jgi:hypothetical protein
MTEKLKTLMDSAADQDFAAVDLDAIVTAGDRTVRRRGAAVAAAGLAAAAVTVAGAVLVVGSGGTGGADHDVTSTPVESAGLSWAVGTTIHTPAGAIDTGHPVRAYVRTALGYVTVDDRGHVYSVAPGSIVRVGEVQDSSLYLVADDETALAAWLERGTTGWKWVVLDQAILKRVTEVPAGSGRDVPGAPKALDEGRLLVSSRGYEAIETPSGAITPFERPAGAEELLDVEDGVSVWVSRPAGEDETSSYLIDRSDGGTVTIPEVRGSTAALSPDARWVSFDSDEPRVHDATSGEQVTLDIGDRVFATGYEWLDADTVAVIASATDAGPVELLACDVPDGSCTVAEADLGTFDGLLGEGFALPTGTEIDD